MNVGEYDPQRFAPAWAAMPGSAGRFYDRYGKHDPWRMPCGGFSLEQYGFDFTSNPGYVGKHRDLS